jgi:hypothetical protein
LPTPESPSMTPRPPQGQPLVTALAHDALPYEFAARGADVVHVTPHSRAQASELTGLPLDRQGAGDDGHRLRPGVLPRDLTAITDGLVPELRRRSAFRHEDDTVTLREPLGPPRPVIFVEVA